MIPCDGRTSHIAYILVADPKDTNGDSHNNGKYAMYLTISQPGTDKGPYQIKAGENLNPVKTLRMRYDAWKKTQHAAERRFAESASAARDAARRRRQLPESPRRRSRP